LPALRTNFVLVKSGMKFRALMRPLQEQMQVLIRSLGISACNRSCSLPGATGATRNRFRAAFAASHAAVDSNEKPMQALDKVCRPLVRSYCGAGHHVAGTAWSVGVSVVA